ncbi:ribosomal protein S18, putative [Plasmodium ovale wallikeri]|uniref:Ribosomal protein S18, putative n=1 Tax=Plasmodium ovale wallikeri TaxID=864142 RepID=A0A1A8YUL8_PLAOA|nr:ribosomal protein S18, putative [Plasmodium ovale wallikeri]SBT35823.1 ribosomal protein S18, putative [Plasmodium ovale wallikeri]
MSLQVIDQNDFQHILRILNTNVDGKEKVTIALTAIKGIGKRMATVICKQANVSPSKRAGELTTEEINNVSLL